MKNNEVIAETISEHSGDPKGGRGGRCPLGAWQKNEHWICRSKMAGWSVKLQLLAPCLASQTLLKAACIQQCLWHS